MKKLLSAFLALVLLVSLTACDLSTTTDSGSSISLTHDAAYFTGMDKDAAERRLRSMGFTNIEYKKETTDDLQLDNKVIKIQIYENWFFPDEDFEVGDKYASDCTIYLCYYTYTATDIPECNYHSSNNEQIAATGNTGTYAFCRTGEYDVFWIIDFTGGYAYNFTNGNGNDSCEMMRLCSGDLNTSVKIDVQYDGDTYTYNLKFKKPNDSSALIFVDHLNLEYAFKPYDLSTAYEILETKYLTNISVPAEKYYSNTGLEYTVNANGISCTITDIGNFTDSQLIIPEQIEDYTVTNIGESAFSYCEQIESVLLPDTVIHIADYAFEGCNNLQAINLPDSLIYLGATCFMGCSIREITIPEGLTKINASTFYGNPISEIVIPESVVFIGCNAFSGCSELVSVTIPEGVTMLNAGVFSDCTSLENVYISNKMEKLIFAAFYGCTSLTSITYSGTTDEWNNLSKENGWDYDTPEYVVYCNDGTVNK